MTETCPFALNGEAAYARAFRSGDVVILRVQHMSYDLMEHNRKYLSELTQRTGVEFLLLDSEVEVVEGKWPDPTDHRIPYA